MFHAAAVQVRGHTCVWLLPLLVLAPPLLQDCLLRGAHAVFTSPAPTLSALTSSTPVTGC